jgi:ribosome-associated protein
VEEDPDGSWTLVDLGDIIVHIMLPQTREHYDLEKLWGAELAAKNRKHVT